MTREAQASSIVWAMENFFLNMESLTALLFLLLRFYGQSEDGDEFNNSIRQLFLAFNTLMDRPLEEAVKIKVSMVSVWVPLLMLLLRMFCDSRTGQGGRETK